MHRTIGLTASVVATALFVTLGVAGPAGAEPDAKNCAAAGGRPASPPGSSLRDRVLLGDDVDVSGDGTVLLDLRFGLLDPDGDARGVRSRNQISDPDQSSFDNRFAIFDDEDASSGRVIVNVHDLDDIDRDVSVTQVNRDSGDSDQGRFVVPRGPAAGGNGDERQVEDDGAFVFQP